MKFEKLHSYFFVGMITSAVASIGARFILNSLTFGKFFIGVSMTCIGLELSLICLGFVTNIKKVDFEYFRMVMIGIVGGLVVWILTGLNLSSKGDFWISLNNVIIRGLISLSIIVIGFIISIKRKKKLK